MVEVPQQKQWSRQYDGGFYNSTDGKNWKLLGKKDPDWSKKWADHNKRIISDASEFKCGLTKVIDGKEYPGLSYRFKVEKPHKQDYTSVEYYDPETFVLKQSIINQQNFELTTTYEKDTTIALSPPE